MLMKGNIMFERDLEYIQAPLAKQELLCLIYQNNNITECCARLNINPAALAWAMKEDKQFKADIHEAQAFMADLAVDALQGIHEEIDNPLTARVVSDNIKWVAAKRYKERYGDKVDIAVTHTIDLKSAIADANQRTLTFIDGKCLEINNTTTDKITVDAVNLDDLDVFA